MDLQQVAVELDAMAAAYRSLPPDAQADLFDQHNVRPASTVAEQCMGATLLAICMQQDAMSKLVQAMSDRVTMLRCSHLPQLLAVGSKCVLALLCVQSDGTSKGLLAQILASMLRLMTTSGIT